jgi:hypothetical protein
MVFPVTPYTIYDNLGDRVVRPFHIGTFVDFREDETEQVRVL